jgi:hypothetical protein
MAKLSGPEILIIPMPPGPNGVDMAAMVEGFMVSLNW